MTRDEARVLFKRYDELQWSLAESYGASTRHGFSGSPRTTAGLHGERTMKAKDINRIRELLINSIGDDGA